MEKGYQHVHQDTNSVRVSCAAEAHSRLCYFAQFAGRVSFRNCSHWEVMNSLSCYSFFFLLTLLLFFMTLHLNCSLKNLVFVCLFRGVPFSTQLGALYYVQCGDHQSPYARDLSIIKVFLFDFRMYTDKAAGRTHCCCI